MNNINKTMKNIRSAEKCGERPRFITDLQFYASHLSFDFLPCGHLDYVRMDSMYLD